MKNIFLTLALLLTVSFAFAEKGIENKTPDLFINSSDIGFNNLTETNNDLLFTCYVTVYIYDSSGRYVGYVDYVFENVASESDCYYLGKGVGLSYGIY